MDCTGLKEGVEEAGADAAGEQCNGEDRECERWERRLARARGGGHRLNGADCSRHGGTGQSGRWAWPVQRRFPGAAARLAFATSRRCLDRTECVDERADGVVNASLVGCGAVGVRGNARQDGDVRAGFTDHALCGDLIALHSGIDDGVPGSVECMV